MSTNVMNPVVEAVEVQFITLTKQIQIEKEMCNNLDLQLAKIRDSSKHIKETNKVKNSLKTSISVGIKCSENNCLSSQTSLDVTSGLENELKKIMEQQNNESKRKQLMERLWNYEKQWETVKNMYKELPSANDALAIQLLTKQMSMEVKIKTQNVKDTKSFISNYRDITDKKRKTQIINLINSSTKNKISSKKKLDRKEKFRTLNVANNKVKIEKSSLIGKQHNNLPSNPVYRKTKVMDGFAVPSSYGILGQKFKGPNVYQKLPFSLGPASPLTVPELMIPSFRSSTYKNVSQATSSTTTNAMLLDGTEEMDGNSSSNPKKRKIEDCPILDLHAKIHVTMGQDPDASKNGNSFVEHRTSTPLPSKHSTSTASDGRILSHELTKEGNCNLDRISGSLHSLKYISHALHQMSPQQQAVTPSETANQHHDVQCTNSSSVEHKSMGTEAAFNFGPRGFQAIFENAKTGANIKAASCNSDSKRKQTNVWDMFN